MTLLPNLRKIGLAEYESNCTTNDKNVINAGILLRVLSLSKRLFNKLVRSQAANQKSCHGDVNHSSACIG
jgi:hypothetical protein